MLDRLNDLLISAEDALDDLGFRVSAETNLDDDKVLSWCKDGAEWGLRVRMPSGDVVDLVKTSARIRIQAAGKLGSLLEALRVADLDRNGAVLDAIRQVEGFNELCKRVDGATPHQSKEIK